MGGQEIPADELCSSTPVESTSVRFVRRRARERSDNERVLGRYLSAFSGSLALHAALLLILVWPVRTSDSRQDSRPPSPPALTPSLTVFAVPQEDARFPGLKPVDPASAARIQPLDEDSAVVSIGDFKFDASKLVQRAAVLFPFLSPGISLDHFAIRPGDERVLVYERPAPPHASRGRGPLRPLQMSDRAIQALIDSTWSRRERWDAFQPIAALAPRYSAANGAMPGVFQRYTDQNALQPYRDMAIRDPRLWTQLGLAADHVSFIKFIREYAAEHPGTRGAIELLFLLDRIAEASEDALQTLLDCNPEEDLQWTRANNRDAYRLALQLRTYYRAQMSRLGILSKAALAGHYAGVRLTILDGILRTTPDGYRANDARFLRGAIQWRQGHRAEALAAWRGITAVAGDSYRVATEQLVAALGADDANHDAVQLARQIDRVLKNDVGRWWDFSYDRLKQFGYRFDTY